MSRRPNPPAIHIIVALLVILLPVILIQWLAQRPGEGPTGDPEVELAIQAAREQSPYAVLVPDNLPEAWQPLRASWLNQGQPGLNGEPEPGNTWRLVYLGPDQVAYSLTQRDGPAAVRIVPEMSREGTADGASSINGQEWERLVSEDGRTRSLVRSADGVTTVISADTSYEAIDAYASTLA